MNNLIIIGNGFDLAHGLKTSYNSFINHIIDSHLINRDKFNTLIRINNNITNKEQLKEYARKTPIRQMQLFPNKFFGLLFASLSIENWCDIEKKYYSVLTEEGRYNSVKMFHEDFEEIKLHLANYLNNVKLSSKGIKNYDYLFSKLITQNSLILNFNYTNTLQNYTKQSHILSTKQIINIHGELNNLKNPMIFGFAANNQESRTLINKDDKEYMRYIKKHCYKRTNNEDNLKFYLEFNKNINVFILGHSCGISDKLILNQIFNHRNIDSIRVFYFENHEKYFETQVNIDRIMNNDTNFNKLKSFEDSIRMPQINDTEEQNAYFNGYIQRFIKNNTSQGMSAPSIH